MKPWNLQNCFTSWRSALKDKSFSKVFQKRKTWTQRTEAIIEGRHFIKCVCTESIVLGWLHCKAKKAFTIGEELVLPAAKDICRELFGEAVVQKVARAPLSASTITRLVGEIAENIEAQLLERINKSPWHIIQVDESTDVDNKATMLVFVRYIFRFVLCPFIANQHHSCRTIQVFERRHIRTAKLVILCWYMQTEWLPWLDVFLVSLLGSKRSLLNVSLCTVSLIEKCWLAEKCHLNLTTFCRMWLKLSTLLKHMPLTHVCSHSSVKRWTQNTHVFSYTQKWDGFLKVDHWPEFLGYKSCSRDFS